MPAHKGNQYAKGNKGGRPSKYKSEYAEIAQKLCARLGFTDEQLADWFEVTLSTIHQWRLNHQEFSDACRAGKAETDDFVERATVKHIEGYYVTVEEMDRHGNVKKMRKWVPGNAHAGMKWLSSRRPEVYREQKNVRHALSMDDAFLRFLDQIEIASLALASSPIATRKVSCRRHNSATLSRVKNWQRSACHGRRASA